MIIVSLKSFVLSVVPPTFCEPRRRMTACNSSAPHNIRKLQTGSSEALQTVSVFAVVESWKTVVWPFR